jgi:MFS family permease
MRSPFSRARAQGERALDLLNLFIADAQTGFGAFLAVYLTAHKWAPVQIGMALSIGTVVTILSQIPAGMLVDALRGKRLAVAGGVIAITGAALLFAALPYQLPVAVAEILHGFASCVLTPAVAAVSLRLVGPARLGTRLGRNARFAAIGNGTAAAAMGALGTYVSTRSVFLLTAALAIPALLALSRVGDGEAVAAPAPARARKRDWHEIWSLLSDRRLLIFCGCIFMFHLANAAMLPIAAGAITESAGDYASLIIAACIMVPQAVVALLSPWFGTRAGAIGRRSVLLIGWTALPARAVLFALLPAPGLIVCAQVLDGVSAAVFGVMLPLTAADLTRGKDRFNLCIGIFGLAIGIGAALSTSLAGWIADLGGDRLAFVALAGAGLLGLLLLALAMPETAPAEQPAPKREIFRPAMRAVSCAPAPLVAARVAPRAYDRRPGLRTVRRGVYARPMRGGPAWRLGK